MTRYTVYTVLGDGNPYDVLTTEDPLAALQALEAQQAKYSKPDASVHIHSGIFDPDDPERGDVQDECEEQVECSTTKEPTEAEIAWERSTRRFEEGR